MSKTGWPIEYFFGTYKKICNQTNNDCQQCNCLYFHNTLKLDKVNDCPYVQLRMAGLTIRQIMTIALFFRYFDYDFLLNQKYQLVDVVNGLFSKENRELSWKNIFSNPLLSTLFVNNDQVIISENDTVSKLISEIMFSNDYNLKYTKFNIVRKKISEVLGNKNSVFFQFLNFINFVFEDFFKDGNITNNVLQSKDDKILIIHILLNIYKILLLFPKHVKTNKGKDVVSAITTKMKGKELNNETVDYLKGDYDTMRLSDFTSDDEVVVFISSIDSYYFLYKKYNIGDKNLYCLFEVYDYIETLLEKKGYSESINNLFNECLKILRTICKNTYDLSIENLF